MPVEYHKTYIVKTAKKYGYGGRNDWYEVTDENGYLKTFDDREDAKAEVEAQKKSAVDREYAVEAKIETRYTMTLWCCYEWDLKIKKVTVSQDARNSYQCSYHSTEGRAQRRLVKCIKDKIRETASSVSYHKREAVSEQRRLDKLNKRLKKELKKCK